MQSAFLVAMAGRKKKVRGTHTDTHDIELETTLQELALDLRGDAVETDMAVGEDGGLLSRSSAGSGGHCGSASRMEQR